MARRKLGKESVRNIQRSSGSYLVSIPVHLVRKFGWQERQKVVLVEQGKNKILIKDWKK